MSKLTTEIHFVTGKRTWGFKPLTECDIIFSNLTKLETTKNPYLVNCGLCQQTEVFKELTDKYPEHVRESV